MGTRSFIGKELASGKIKFIYCHWDGYPDHNGRILKQHYNTDKQVDKLLSLGDLSQLGEEIGKKQDFDNPKDGWCLAYHRDRGQKLKDVKASTIKSVYELMKIAGEGYIEYIYIFERDKTWHTIEI